MAAAKLLPPGAAQLSRTCIPASPRRTGLPAGKRRPGHSTGPFGKSLTAPGYRRRQSESSAQPGMGRTAPRPPEWLPGFVDQSPARGFPCSTVSGAWLSAASTPSSSSGPISPASSGAEDGCTGQWPDPGFGQLSPAANRSPQDAHSPGPQPWDWHIVCPAPPPHGRRRSRGFYPYRNLIQAQAQNVQHHRLQIPEPAPDQLAQVKSRSIRFWSTP